MTVALRVRNQAQSIFNRALSGAWKAHQLWDPSVWLLQEPEAPEKIRRDPDILRALDYRDQLVAGRQWSLTPMDDASPIGELSVDVGTKMLGHLKKFTESRLLAASVYFSGQIFQRIHTRPKVLPLGDGRLRTWIVPTKLEHMDKRFYRQVPDWDKGELKGANWERWHIGAAKWVPETTEDLAGTIEHTYKGSHANLNHGQALLEALAWCWHSKTHVWQESLQAVEKHAQGVMTAKVDGAREAATGNPNETVIQAWVDQLEDMRARHVMVYDSADEIEVLTGNSEGWQLLDTIEQKLVDKIDRLVLGAVLPTGGGGDTGSLARAGVEEDSTESLVQFDREALEETLTDDLIGALWRMNYPNLLELGIYEEPPLFNISHQKKEDPKEVAEVASILHDAGFDLSADDIYERTGNKKPEEGEDIIPGVSAPDPMAGGFGDPFGQPPGQPGQLPPPQQPQPAPFGAGVPS